MNIRTGALLLAYPLLGCSSPLGESIDLSECDTNLAEPVAWDASTELGTSPAQAFAGRDQSCSAPLSWDAAPFTRLTIQPQSGQSTMNVRMTVDRASSRIERPAAGSPSGCQPVLAADADVELASADGSFVATGRVLLIHKQTRVLVVHVDSPEHAGSLQIGTETRSDLAFMLDSVGTPCTGRVLMNERAPAAGANTVTGVLAKWSNTP